MSNEQDLPANWNAVNGSTSYRLDVSTAANFSSFVQQDVTVNGTNHAITGLTAGTTYHYRVRAVNATGPSANSNAINVATAAAAAGGGTLAIPFYVNVGGSAYTDDRGRAFMADNLGNAGRIATSRNAIAGTVNDHLYQSDRYGNMQLDFPVPNGTYQIELHFAETYLSLIHI